MLKLTPSSAATRRRPAGEAAALAVLAEELLAEARRPRRPARAGSTGWTVGIGAVAVEVMRVLLGSAREGSAARPRRGARRGSGLSAEEQHRAATIAPVPGAPQARLPRSRTGDQRPRAADDSEGAWPSTTITPPRPRGASPVPSCRSRWRSRSPSAWARGRWRGRGRSAISAPRWLRSAARSRPSPARTRGSRTGRSDGAGPGREARRHRPAGEARAAQRLHGRDGRVARQRLRRLAGVRQLVPRHRRPRRPGRGRAARARLAKGRLVDRRARRRRPRPRPRRRPHQRPAGRRGAALAVGPGACVRAGDTLVLVGSPYGLEGTVTTGIVSRVTKKESRRTPPRTPATPAARRSTSAAGSWACSSPAAARTSTSPSRSRSSARSSDAASPRTPFATPATNRVP